MQRVKDSAGNTIWIPSLKKASTLLRTNLWVKRKYPILKAYVVGSVAKGTATPDSDLDIALIIPPVRGKSSIKVSEFYHARFEMEHQMPQFEGRRVDFQFFYESDQNLLDTYSKIELK